MKKFISMALSATLLVAGLAGCGSNEAPVASSEPAQSEVVSEQPSEEASEEASEEVVTSDGLYKVALTTDSGTIDDKSFNQGAYQGIMQYEEANGTIESTYVKPLGESEQDYLASFADLVDAGYELIVCPGYKFESAVLKAQDLYPEVKFVIIDGAPNVDFVPTIADNTFSIYFAEHEAGFYAGVVAALTSNTGKLGFIGGMEIPAVQKFGWGYTAGVAYANENLGTSAEVTQYLYQGTFTDVADGKAKAGDFYNQGVDVIFAAAGGVGIGVIGEAKVRRDAGEDVWVIGVDSDQYDEGIYAEGKSAILTSALKNIPKSTYDAIDAAVNDEWVGGVSVVLTTEEDAVKLPDSNPNISDDVIAIYEEVYSLVKEGTLVVPETLESLESYLDSVGYVTSDKVSSY